MAINLKDKVAIITGASSGIGAATAVYFARFGAALSITGRNGENLNQTRDKCVQSKVQVLCSVGDITEQAHAKNLVSRTLEHFGKIDILVNNAGIGVMGMLADAPMDSYDKVMNINCRAAVQLTQMCIGHLIATKGSIVNFPDVGFYNMSKAALDQFTKCLALEMAPNRVRVNSVNPGVTLSNVHKRMGLNEEQYASFLEHSKDTHALGRVAEAEEVAKAIAFLASEATFTTGELLRIDGGRGLMTPR